MTQTEIAKAARTEAAEWQIIRDWYANTPDPDRYGDLADTFAAGIAQRLDGLIHWLTWEAEKREQGLAAVR